MGNVGKSPFHKSKDILLKYYFGKSKSQPYEQHVGKGPRESDIKCTQVSKVQMKVNLDELMRCIL